MIKRVLFSGGGTGGHIFMAVALAQALRQRSSQTEVLFIGSHKGVEGKILPALGFSYETIKIGGLKGVGGLQTALTILQAPLSLWSSWRIIKRFSPSIIVGLGGYSSGPAMLVGRWMGIPSLVIEPNAYPGLANRLAARWAHGAAIAFPETAEWFGSKSRLTGIPIRQEFHRIDSPISQAGPLRLLIFGGSQGSRPINRLVCEALPLLSAAEISIVHQTGLADFLWVKERYEAAGCAGEVLDFIQDMPDRFSRADLIVSRAGASTLAEMTATGRPAILIPLPQAADDHQRKNARALESKGAALVLEQAETSGETLARLLRELANDRHRLHEMSRASRQLAQPESTAKIIEFMEELVFHREENKESDPLDLQKTSRFHFIGMGGIGMSGLAEILLRGGSQVSGSDLKDNPLLERLRALGARVFIGHDAAHVEGAGAVIFSSAVREDNPELARARSLGLPALPRGQLLAELMRTKKGIAISGTHGKTTTTSMIGLMLVQAGLDPTVVVGARFDAFQSNVRLGRSEWFAAEADESDRSFLLLSPFCAVATNIDLDHMDEYRNLHDLQQAFWEYMEKVPENGLVVACGDDPNLAPVLKKLHRRVVTYGLRPGVDICARKPDLAWRRSSYHCYAGERLLGQIELKVAGRHNVINSLAAVAVGVHLVELPFDAIAQSLAAFQGAERRLQWKGEKRGVWVIDDYAHHPVEIQATLQACRTSGRRIVAVFQPHRYSRTQNLMRELGSCFADADVLYLMNIYAAGEKPISGVTSERLAREIAGQRQVHYRPDRGELLAHLEREARDGDLLVTLGAGDVWEMGEKFLETDE